ncbi:MAG: isoprenyl transferase [Bacteroidetes bacterium]|nr:isoprenyl transferase [Rhodothermia bacterium]MCS7155191.1 isoprenyl transferase [Bacteroidota bacterium]MCX7906182.1 isoprenyl transferase [Bacteroidota bacterium]MDW8138309.1 isoprenyl transferase [Bacteroidota bacterium]MDW8285994.1 isoprenyl transferase [Bacteroidota bacterium]
MAAKDPHAQSTPSAQDRAEQEALRLQGPLPRHVAIIMDGNGRWARKRGLPRVAGHRAAVAAVRDVVEACAELGIPYLTLYAFSTENWARPVSEVNALMELLVRTLRRETRTLRQHRIRLNAVGDLERLPSSCRDELLEAMERTRSGERMVLTLALSYGGRWEITEAVRRIAQEVAAGNLDPERITEAVVAQHLSTAGMPDPDLVIRTSNEFRVSNFLLWQIAYAEFYVTPCLWPDFRRVHLYEAIRSFQSRERRYGRTSEQVAAFLANGQPVV